MSEIMDKALLLVQGTSLERVVKTIGGPNIRGPDGRSLMHYLVMMEMPNLVEPLTQLGADVSASDKAGDTPLHLATERCHLALVTTLIKAGAVIDARNRFGNHAHLPQLGAEQGMIVLSRASDLHSIQEFLSEGYGYALLDEPVASQSFGIDDYIEMFRDWSWSDTTMSAPQWMR